MRYLRTPGSVDWAYGAPGAVSTPSSGGGSTLYPVFTTSGTGPFTVGIQVTNLATGSPVAQRHWVLVTIGTGAYLTDATGGITYNTETTHWEFADGLTQVMTDSNGFCEITISASADRYVSAAVGSERAYSSGVLTYGVVSHPVGLITRLTPLGIPGRRSGSFAGR